jgi:plastocyanin
MPVAPRAPLCSLAALAAGLCLGATPPVVLRAAGGSTIRGRVEVRRLSTPSDRRPTVAALGAPPARQEPDRRQSVVYLDTAPRGAFESTEPERAVMDQRGETFVPHVLAISAGTTVDFPNSDRIYHNVFSLSKTMRFDLGRYPTGRAKSVKFDRPGIVRVFCDIHSHMNAFVLVFGHPFFAITDLNGRYAIPDVPPGSYRVVAWNEGVAADPKPVTLNGVDPAELDLVVP